MRPLGDETGVDDVWPVWLSAIRDGGHDLSPESPAVAPVVSGHVGSDGSQKRGECAGIAALVGIGKLRDRLDDVAKTAQGYGASG